MGRFSENRIDSYEKKISIFQICQMVKEGRIVFPVVSSGKKSKRIKNVSEMLEAILLGIALPVVYVSERQDGSFLVLNSDDRLLNLILFLEGEYPLTGLEFYPELEGYRIEQLERYFPRGTSRLYDYSISFQVIEYTTPKYMHIQVGNYIEQWDFAREQGVRNKLYGNRLEEYLHCLARFLERSVDFFSRRNLNRQYMVLRILMYRFAYEGVIRVRQMEQGMGLQQLLDRTFQSMDNMDMLWEEKMARELMRAIQALNHWGRSSGFDLAKDKGKERQARTLGYLCHVVWLCWGKGDAVQQGLSSIAFDKALWREIHEGKENFAHIQRQFDEIEKRLS